ALPPVPVLPPVSALPPVPVPVLPPVAALPPVPVLPPAVPVEPPSLVLGSSVEGGFVVVVGPPQAARVRVKQIGLRRRKRDGEDMVPVMAPGSISCRSLLMRTARRGATVRPSPRRSDANVCESLRDRRFTPSSCCLRPAWAASAGACSSTSGPLSPWPSGS